MREILFKAKRIDDGEWVEGSLIFSKDAEEGWEAVIIPTTDSYMFVKEYEGDLGFEKWYAVDKDTICQYTGLTDKNGNKIWENDVVRGHGNPDDLAKVVLGEFYIIDVETLEKVESVVGWHTEVIETDVISKVEPFCLPMPLTKFYIKRSEYEVIGNIFDNPELVERN